MAIEEDDDAFLDQFVRKPGKPAPEWGLKDLDNMYEEFKRIPLFMKEPPQDFENYPELVALQSMLYEGSPDEVATNFKNHGNEAYKSSRYKDAVAFYGKGIEIAGAASSIRSVLLLNRSAVLIEMGHCANAALDAIEAVRLDGSLVKGYYRCAKALYSLDRVHSADKYLALGLSIDSTNSSLLQLKEQVDLRLRGGTFNFSPVGGEALDCLRERGISSVSSLEWACSQMQQSTRNAIIDVTGDGCLLFPVLLLYPHYGLSDYIERCDERASPADYLAMAFGTRAPWDSDGLYVDLSDMECYYEHYDRSYPISTSIRRFDRSRPFGELLRLGDFVLSDGTCHLIVAPRNQPHHLQGYTIIE